MKTNNTSTLLWLTISLLSFPHILSLSKQDVDKVYLYVNELCSYNGEPTIINETTRDVQCICQPGYVDDLNKGPTFKGYKVKCSYERKKRFVAFFLALFLPWGFDYLYLDYLLAFFGIFIYMWLLFVLSIVYFFKTNKFSDVDNSSKFPNNDSKMESTTENNKFTCLTVCVLLMSIVAFVFWITNAVLMGLGVITDGSGFRTENDMNFLFRIKATQS